MQVNSFTASSWCITLPICIWGDTFVLVFLDSPYFIDFKELYSAKFGSECQGHQVFPWHIWYFCQCFWTSWISHGRRKCRTMTAISWPLTGKNRSGRGRCVRGVWTETAKVEELYVRKNQPFWVVLFSLSFHFFVCMYEFCYQRYLSPVTQIIFLLLNF